MLSLCSVPRKAPILPREHVPQVARFGFHTLLLPLIYSSIAKAINIQDSSIQEYWFIFVAGILVVSLSYAIASALSLCLLSKSTRHQSASSIQALKIAASFPNIVALPILIFPSLCEYPVVYEGFVVVSTSENNDKATDPVQSCRDQANSMIFLYFFSWSLMFWTLGHKVLVKSSLQRESKEERSKKDSADSAQIIIPPSTVEDNDDMDEEHCGDRQDGEARTEQQPAADQTSAPFYVSLLSGIKQTISSPGFIAMICGLITACIPPLQSALFDAGGSLRFLGSAVETLGVASSSVSTMVVAASLVQEQQQGAESSATPDHEDNPVLSDPNFGPLRKRRRASIRQSFRKLRNSFAMSTNSTSRHTALEEENHKQSQSHMRSLHVWFCVSRLLVTPAVVVALILVLDCTTAWSVPPLAKLVVIINASLPGALIIVVVLQQAKTDHSNNDSQEQEQHQQQSTASVVASTYLPSYLLSIVTIAAWSSVGLWMTLPNDDENDSASAVCPIA